MADRDRLRFTVLSQYRVYDRELGRLVVPCAWCGEPIDADLALHEWLVKRSAVPRDKQHLIMVPENIAPLHNRKCHIPHGQTREMALRCLYQAARSVGADRVGAWYVALWQEHGLSVPRGLLLPQKRVPVSLALQYYRKGAALLGITSDPGWDTDTAVGAAIARWHGKSVESHSSDSIPLERRVAAISTGYWVTYLEGVIGLLPTP